MTTQNNEDTTSSKDVPANTQMARYDIKRVPVDHFRYRKFSYTNLPDAIAQAKRNNEVPRALPRHAEGAGASDHIAVDDEAARYGIKRVPVDHFHYRQFRYTNLHDAIAQAQRTGEAAGA